ncbi:hypothetical protein D3C87_2115670 [compost metagenome]
MISAFARKAPVSEYLAILKLEPVLLPVSAPESAYNNQREAPSVCKAKLLVEDPAPDTVTF